MIERIRQYLEQAFAGAPQTAKVLELREELFTNLLDKYNDLLRQGCSEEEAYAAVIAGVGDLEELVRSVQEPSPLSPEPQQYRTRRAAVTAIAVMLYILSPFAAVLFSELLYQDTIGVLVMMFLIAAATGLLIFNHMSRPVYVKNADTVVEDFKAWRSVNGRRKSAWRSFRAAFWCLVVVVYLGSSFLFNIWPFSWLIFIMAAAVEGIVRGILALKEEDR
ncbi:MAG: hypothetical protein HFJ80_05725 [Clostridiales bacterium]|nr:hypothetical protein [Clostridiales bacterium]